MRLILAALLLGAPYAATAHSFGRMVTLPMPFWLYAWGAAAALVLGFVVAAVFMRAHPGGGLAPPRTTPAHPAWQGLAVIGPALLGVVIVIGGWGPIGAYQNLSMTLFWIGFVLLQVWSTALVDLAWMLNPWRSVAALLGCQRGRWRYPTGLGQWPAFGGMLVLIWLELMGNTGPRGLALGLGVYSALMLFGCWAFGYAWLRHADCFTVWLDWIGRMAPLRLRQGEDGRWYWQRDWPLVGLLREDAASTAAVMFLLFLLAATAFDGLRETVPWVRLYWTDLYRALTPPLSTNPFEAFPQLRRWYVGWNSAALLLAPWLYAVCFWGALALCRVFAATSASLSTLVRAFAPSLLPIVLVYHLTHYWTLLLTQGLKIFPLMSDPLDTGADFFGTRGWFQRAVIPDMVAVWHLQVGLIVLGHVISVALAHQVALRFWPQPMRAVQSQLPMLALMLLFTASGLWILSQPLQPGG